MGAGLGPLARDFAGGGGGGSSLNSSHYLLAHYLAGTFNLPRVVGIIPPPPPPHDEEMEAQGNNYQGRAASM